MNRTSTWQYWVLLFAILVLAASILFQIFDLDTLFNRLYGSLIGVVLTAIVTVFLLQGQTQSQEKREKSIKIFEKKQAIYHDFLVHLNSILQDGKLTIPERGSVERNEYIDLIFQISYLKLHATEENTQGIISQIEKILDLLSMESTYNKDMDRSFYLRLTEELLQLMHIMRKDLYGDNTTENSISVNEIAQNLTKYALKKIE